MSDLAIFLLILLAPFFGIWFGLADHASHKRRKMEAEKTTPTMESHFRKMPIEVLLELRRHAERAYAAGNFDLASDLHEINEAIWEKVF